MRGFPLRRRLVAVLLLGLTVTTQTGSVQAPFQSQTPSAQTVFGSDYDNRVPLRCFDNRLQWWSRQTPTSTWPKTYVVFDMVRRDRCRGRRVAPSPRLHGFVVLSRDKLSLGVHFKGNPASPLIQVCQSMLGTCLDVHFELYWQPHFPRARTFLGSSGTRTSRTP
jgi:hypothetical protein